MGRITRSAAQLGVATLVWALTLAPGMAQTEPTSDPGGEAAAKAAGDFADSYATRVGSADQNGKGPVSGLAMPRYVSLKGHEGNARRGPSLSHRKDWVFRHEGMPLLLTAEFGHWRRVEDRDGAGGWVHYTLLSGVRNVTVVEDMTPFHARPDLNSEVVARAETGVIARLGACTIDLCRISADGARGWVSKTAIWGVDADEIRE